MSILWRHWAATMCVLSIRLAIIVLSISSVSASQCYDDAETAYAAVLAEDTQVSAVRQQYADNALVNLNTASEGELVTLSGIGSRKAQEIILYREMFGDFVKIDDLTKVKGIGEKTVEKNRQRLSVE